MFANPNNPAQAKTSAVYKIISSLGTALGIGAAILATPVAFGRTKQPLFEYLLQTWSESIAQLLTYIFAGVEAFLIYGSTKLIFTSLVAGAMTAFAARRLGG